MTSERGYTIATRFRFSCRLDCRCLRPFPHTDWMLLTARAYRIGSRQQIGRSCRQSSPGIFCSQCQISEYSPKLSLTGTGLPLGPKPFFIGRFPLCLQPLQSAAVAGSFRAARCSFSTPRNFPSHAGCAGHAGPVTRFPSTTAEVISTGTNVPPASSTSGAQAG